ncbi:hypothetical protein [Erythrobacter dokdonensis]|uniref:DUF3618 domain-containing protein n=1 Tax=Erythrobacter dokdonensis DSW-74 TaxID=1300349 RepID=A0A1A7BND5_9SPHN|nr:hypothetical protein [Erythrobacter dokdonensis]OBV12675.1 hypothetical protein I603_0806 [Erythrobacter dokdonensis DSW-74]
MTDLPARYLEDRALRDAARAVLDEDMARLRASLAEQGVASRVSSSVGSTVSSRIRTGANDVLEQAKQRASDNPGVLAVLIGAILLWLMRAPILALIDEVAESASVPEPEIEDTGGEESGDDDAATMAAVAGDDA